MFLKLITCNHYIILIKKEHITFVGFTLLEEPPWFLCVIIGEGLGILFAMLMPKDIYKKINIFTRNSL